MRTAFHQQLDALTATLSQMCGLAGLAGLAMERATQALLQADLVLAERVISDHDHLTRMQAERHPRLRTRNPIGQCRRRQGRRPEHQHAQRIRAFTGYGGRRRTPRDTIADPD
jgi:phosphate uptake regulator